MVIFYLNEILSQDRREGNFQGEKFYTNYFLSLIFLVCYFETKLNKQKLSKGICKFMFFSLSHNMTFSHGTEQNKKGIIFSINGTFFPCF